jgi:uncharacterized damage-inducible protein DinB
MEWYDLLVDAYERLPDFLYNVLESLSEDNLDWQPRSDCNSIGWLAWHLTRQQDAQIASLMNEQQLWVSGGWAQRFNYSPDPGDIGFGHTPEQVSSYKSADMKTILEYHHAVLERTKRYLVTLSQTDLDRELDEPWFQPLPTVGIRLVSILEDSLLHAGQAAYIRGLIQGKGWQKH